MSLRSSGLCLLIHASPIALPARLRAGYARQVERQCGPSAPQPEEEMRHSGTRDTEIFGDKEILQISPLTRGWNG
jgi:hypothetical protein